MLEVAAGFLAAADMTRLATRTQARALRVFEQNDALETAARTWVLGAFAAGQGYLDDADHSPRAWLVHKTRVTKGAAAGHVAWVRRFAAHPLVGMDLSAGVISQSFARTICGWTDRLPADCREPADEILLAAARARADLADLARLAEEIYTRSLLGPDLHPGLDFEDRGIRLESTLDGAGIVTGDLTPECAAVVRTVLDALSAPHGAEDTRTRAQRYHDALAEAMTRLVAAGMVPERAGQPSKVLAHLSLKDLIDLDAGSGLLWEWAARVRQQWAGHRAAAAITPGDGGAWLEGENAAGFACDASVTPIVFGAVDPTGLDDLMRLCVQLAGHGPFCRGTDSGDHRDPDSGDNGPAAGSPAVPDPRPAPEPPAAPEAPAEPEAPAGAGQVPADVAGPRVPSYRGREALAMAIIGKAVALVSGPGGLASFLRRHEFDGKLAGPSLPLDVGISRDIPAGIRAAVIARDQHCQWPGGCEQPACASQVHHITHQAHGGHTSVKDCKLYCWFHHQVMIHKMGWKITAHPDGTTTATSPDGTRLLHSHGPPSARE
jgi:hypothetical protein